MLERRAGEDAFRKLVAHLVFAACSQSPQGGCSHTRLPVHVVVTWHTAFTLPASELVAMGGHCCISCCILCLAHVTVASAHWSGSRHHILICLHGRWRNPAVMLP